MNERVGVEDQVALCCVCELRAPMALGMKMAAKIDARRARSTS